MSASSNLAHAARLGDGAFAFTCRHMPFTCGFAPWQRRVCRYASGRRSTFAPHRGAAARQVSEHVIRMEPRVRPESKADLREEPGAPARELHFATLCYALLRVATRCYTRCYALPHFATRCFATGPRRSSLGEQRGPYCRVRCTATRLTASWGLRQTDCGSAQCAYVTRVIAHLRQLDSVRRFFV